MSTQATIKPKLKIKAEHIGPIMKLDGQLSDQRQNLIFARNGTGKSFLARSLRLFDKDALDDVAVNEIPDLLVSEESTTKRGNFHLFEDADCIGGLNLSAGDKSVAFSATKYIFHVFSEDYVDQHLRQNRFDLDGNITHEIIVGQENLLLDEKENAALTKRSLEIAKRQALDNKFEKQRGQLRKDFQINAGLGSYKNLSTGPYFEPQAFSGTKPKKSGAELLNDFNKFKSLPNDPLIPQVLEVGEIPIDMALIQEVLEHVTSPSTVAVEVKQKITNSPDFFQTGVELGAKIENCPFCTQDLSDIANKAIDAYRAYFADEEAKQQRIISRLQVSIQTALQSIVTSLNKYLKSKTQYDDLKAFFPSIQAQQINDVELHLSACKNALNVLNDALSSKTKMLNMPIPMPASNFSQAWIDLVTSSDENSRLFTSLEALVKNSSDERKGIQSSACLALMYEFFQSESATISEVRQLSAELKALLGEIAEMKKTQGDKADARTRVAETFDMLLKRFFSSKYTFDAAAFKVLRDKKEMSRGGDRTLSDGEKSVMAFCYFVAQSHLKVAANDDYQKLFFVFDDPVTSMSFDYVYAIVQTLKLWRIGGDGSFDFNPKSGKSRPRMLILTHNNYFYNVASSNNAVKKSGLFQLVSGATEHKLTPQKGFATPHQQQLKHVFDVCEGRITPDFMTPNCIRSVVEGMWKFCRPDCVDFGTFFEFLIDECEIEIKSVLINDLSHGGKFDDPPHKEQDIIEAAKEAIDVVKRFAPGQLKISSF